MTENSATEVNPNISKHKSKSSKLASALALLALAGAAGTGAMVYNLWQQNQQLFQSTSAQITRLQHQLADVSDTLATQQHTLASQRTHMQTLLKTAATDNLSWQLAEAQYLIQLAHFNVYFSHNAQVAISLLQTADARLASLHNPTLLPLRQILANDITALKGVPQVNMTDILLQLNALGTQIATLPVIATPNAVPATTQPHHHHHAQPGWKKGLMQSWEQLKQIIVVQYHDQPVGHLLAPQNRNYLDMHLQMLIAQAQWACLHQQAQLYSNSLQQAISWVSNNYVDEAAQTQAMLAGLRQLQTQNIAPTLPDISNALDAITQQVETPTDNSAANALATNVSNNTATSVNNPAPASSNTAPSNADTSNNTAPATTIPTLQPPNNNNTAATAGPLRNDIPAAATVTNIAPVAN